MPAERRQRLGDRARLAEFARRHRAASVFAFREWVDAEGLLSYGPSINGMYRLAADYVGRIARGAKPSDLPIEQPTKFEFVLNLKTACMRMRLSNKN
jgi:putative ABC transport system substrate-binding protein